MGKLGNFNKWIIFQEANGFKVHSHEIEVILIKTKELFILIFCKKEKFLFCLQIQLSQ